MSLEGRRIVITGASTGIGEATARQCVAAGARVVGLSRNIKEGDSGGVVDEQPQGGRSNDFSEQHLDLGLAGSEPRLDVCLQ